jgi:hypothetical protein
MAIQLIKEFKVRLISRKRFGPTRAVAGGCQLWIEERAARAFGDHYSAAWALMGGLGDHCKNSTLLTNSSCHRSFQFLAENR